MDRWEGTVVAFLVAGGLVILWLVGLIAGWGDWAAGMTFPDYR